VSRPMQHRKGGCISRRRRPRRQAGSSDAADLLVVLVERLVVVVLADPVDGLSDSDDVVAGVLDRHAQYPTSPVAGPLVHLPVEPRVLLTPTSHSYIANFAPPPPGAQLTASIYFRSLSLSKICLDSWLLMLSCTKNAKIGVV